MTETTQPPRPWFWDYDSDTGAWDAVDHPFRIVAAQTLQASAYYRDEIVPLGGPSDADELDLLNTSFVELDRAEDSVAGYTHVALIGPDEDEALPWLIRFEPEPPTGTRIEKRSE